MTDNQDNAATGSALTIDAVIEDFATTEYRVPRASMQWALDHWDLAAPRCLELLARHADGTERTEQTENALLFISRLSAEKAATAAFQDLCRLLLDLDAAPFLAADAITSTLSQILIGTFDGDAALLRSVVEAADVDQYVRHAAITAIAYLTRIGRIPENDTHDWLRRLTATMQPQEQCFVWFGWIESVAALGFADLAPDARLLFERGLIGDGLSVQEFEADLQQTLDDPDRMARFVAKELAPFTGGIEELASWCEAAEPDALPGDIDDGPAGYIDDERAGDIGRRPWTPGGGDLNPWRHIGRNDPCPCGSGRKFKKCCLAKPENERPIWPSPSP